MTTQTSYGILWSPLRTAARPRDTTRFVKTADTAIISPSERCSCTCSGDGIGPDARDLIQD